MEAHSGDSFDTNLDLEMKVEHAELPEMASYETGLRKIIVMKTDEVG